MSCIPEVLAYRATRRVPDRCLIFKNSRDSSLTVFKLISESIDYGICCIAMLGGTPTGAGGFMRQRHSLGYASSGDDLEDDACSRLRNFLPPRTWDEMLENSLWLA
ncbi:unnamed protein product [Trifolium pratense]|uniref:Uncharacterized protein n=1 Tax=Trifolium pratense TaxID=57577 RepID=A0ACB0K5N2_TRIPR|nr:unnamed protein product [Trifolium pratense]